MRKPCDEGERRRRHGTGGGSKFLGKAFRRFQPPPLLESRLPCAVGQPELIEDPRFADIRSRARHFREMMALAEVWMTRQMSEQAILDALTSSAYPAGTCGCVHYAATFIIMPPLSAPRRGTAFIKPVEFIRGIHYGI